MFMLTLETRNFTFTGIGETRRAAFVQLESALRTHATQYRLPGIGFADEGDLRGWRLLPGAYRDHEPLNGSPNNADRFCFTTFADELAYHQAEEGGAK